MKTLIIFATFAFGAVMLMLKFSNSKPLTQFQVDQIEIRKESKAEFGSFGPSKDPEEDDGEWHKGPPSIFSTPLRK